MATWDSADLLARCQRESGVPSTAEFPTSTDWYAWLTEAQAHWYGQFLAVGLQPADWTAPTAMSTADSGKTYTFSGSVRPYLVEIYTADGGDLMLPGAYDDPEADYVWEGDAIRMTRGRTRTFANGPVARWVAPPGAIDGSTAPTLLPDFARVLLVYRACILWASRGGMRDPTVYRALEAQAWYGDPNRGEHGILGMLKMANPMAGAAAYRHGTNVWGREYLFARMR